MWRRPSQVQAGSGTADSAGVAAIYGTIILSISEVITQTKPSPVPEIARYLAMPDDTNDNDDDVLLCLCFASFVSHWHSHSQLLYPSVPSPLYTPPSHPTGLHFQLMLASEAHTLSLSTHCKLHREQCRVWRGERAGGFEIEKKCFLLFTFSMPLFTSYF